MRNEFEPSGILHSEAKTSAKNNVVNFVTSICTTLQKWATKLSRSWQSYVRNAALLYLILSTRRRVRNWPTANWLATTTLDPVHMYMWTFYGDPRGLHTSCTVQAARQNSPTAFPASGDQKKVGNFRKETGMYTSMTKKAMSPTWISDSTVEEKVRKEW